MRFIMQWFIYYIDKQLFKIMKRKISKNELVNYIKEEQVAYKFGDGLVGFTN